jgi:hypothetical protein
MRTVFLDIDGVLNSHAYDRERAPGEGNIDVTRLPLLRELIERTDAKVVLTSSWREHWDPLGAQTDAVGEALAATFLRHGVPLYDRTPALDNNRPAEISAWLADHPAVERFVILDDIKLGWGALDAYVVKTDYRIGRGLELHHIAAALAVLMKTA